MKNWKNSVKQVRSNKQWAKRYHKSNQIFRKKKGILLRETAEKIISQKGRICSSLKAASSPLIQNVHTPLPKMFCYH